MNPTSHLVLAALDAKPVERPSGSLLYSVLIAIAGFLAGVLIASFVFVPFAGAAL